MQPWQRFTSRIFAHAWNIALQSGWAVLVGNALELLDKVQSKASKLIGRFESVKLQSLHHRRVVSGLCSLHRIVHKAAPVALHALCPSRDTSTLKESLVILLLSILFSFHAPIFVSQITGETVLFHIFNRSGILTFLLTCAQRENYKCSKNG